MTETTEQGQWSPQWQALKTTFGGKPFGWWLFGPDVQLRLGDELTPPVQKLWEQHAQKINALTQENGRLRAALEYVHTVLLYDRKNIKAIQQADAMTKAVLGQGVQKGA